MSGTWHAQHHQSTKITIMKRILFVAFLATALSFASCEGEIPGLGTDTPSGSTATVEQIASINKQIASIQSSLSTLTAADTELKQYISALQESGKASGEQIAALQTAQTSLAAKITAAEKSIDQTRDWVSTSFATLEQYNALSEALSEVRSSIPENIPDMEQITASLDKKIAQSSESMKGWINEKLSGYCTLAQAEADLGKLQKRIDESEKDAAQEIAALAEKIASTKQEITEAYKKAIEEAIANGGSIGGGTAADLSAVNKRIDDCMADFESRMKAVEGRLDAIEQTLERLLNRIQSVSTIPTNGNDGDSDAHYVSIIKKTPTDDGTATFYYHISPKSAIDDLEKVWQSALSIKTFMDSKAFTRAAALVELPVTGFSADRETGIITVTASGKNFKDGYSRNPYYYDKTEIENVPADYIPGCFSALSISDGKSDIASDFIRTTVRYDCELHIDNIRSDDFDIEKEYDKHTNINIPAEGGSGTISYSTNYAQEMTARLEFYNDSYNIYNIEKLQITETPEGGIIHLNIPPNTDVQHSVRFHLLISDMTENLVYQSIDIHQEFGRTGAIEVEQEEIVMSVSGDTVTVNIITDHPELLRVECDEDWIIAAELSEPLGDTVQLTIVTSANYYRYRECDIRIYNDYESKYITVYQPVFEIIDEPSDAIWIPSQGGIATLSIKVINPERIKIESSESWIAGTLTELTENSAKLEITASKNPLGYSRESVLYLNLGSGCIVEIRVCQEAE